MMSRDKIDAMRQRIKRFGDRLPPAKLRELLGHMDKAENSLKEQEAAAAVADAADAAASRAGQVVPFVSRPEKDAGA